MREVAQELCPERLRLACTDCDADDFPYALCVYRDGNYYGDGDDPAGLTHLHVGRIDPQIRPVALKRA